ncbi:MAG: GDSL-type esterase/lipase family protein [Bacteroidota bacterium]
MKLNHMSITSFIKTNSQRILCFIVLVAVTSFFSAGCEDNTGPKPASNALNKIMPLGASRVEGARPEFESYRFELWKLLVAGEWDFDYIGTMTDEASYPVFADMSFDLDHEGRGGWTSGQILNGINGWLEQTDSPDFVLFSSPAGNDVLTGMPYDQAISNINSIIDALQAYNPNVTIIIEQLAPGRSDIMTSELTDYFNQLQQDIVTIASEQTTSSSQVITVDMFTGFSDSLLADDVHYNEAGAIFIAERYYAVLQDILKQ